MGTIYYSNKSIINIFAKHQLNKRKVNYQYIFCHQCSRKCNGGLTPVDVLFHVNHILLCSDVDEEEIRLREHNEGATKAADLLLERIHRRNEYYFLYFMEALRRNGYQSIVDEIEPAFNKSCKEIAMSSFL